MKNKQSHATAETGNYAHHKANASNIGVVYRATDRPTLRNKLETLE